MNDLVTFSSSAFSGPLRVVGFRGTEAISRPYEIEVIFTLSGPESETFDMGDATGSKAVLTVDRGDGKAPPFYLAGVMESIELLSEVGDRALFRVILVPRLKELGLSRHSRVFSKRSFVQILTLVLQEAGFGADDFELRLGGYPAEEHVCQYRESDLDFLSRWMEREGIYYSFEHTEDGEKVVFADGKSYEPDALGEPVRYHPEGGQDSSAGACFRSFLCKHATLPSAVKLRDYDYAHPKLDLSGTAAVSASSAAEVSLYGERFFTKEAGERLAKIRAEELRARGVTIFALGNRLHVRPGRTFELEDHPRAAFNKAYLAVEVTHHGNQTHGSAAGGHFSPAFNEVYTAEVTAIPAETQYRAESRTPWPRIYGHENGVVDGAAESEYAQIDDQGRYKVKLYYDESNLKGGAASTFVRMMQPHGGSVEGFHFPLRKGTEVLITFLGGDPDRPVIAGVVPNALTPSPVLAGNHTTNVIQTGAKNRLELEDRAGGERITLSTPHKSTFLKMGAPAGSPQTKGDWKPQTPPPDDNLVLHTDGMGFIDIDSHLHLNVGEHGAGNFIAHVAKDWESTVWEGHHRLDVLEGYSKTTVKKDVDLIILKGDYGIEVQSGSMATTVAKGSMTTDVAQEKTTTVGGFYELTVGEAVEKHQAGGPSGTTQKRRSAGDIIIESKTGDVIRIDAETGEIRVKALGDIKVQSMTGKIGLDAKAGIDITSEGKVNIEGKEDLFETYKGAKVTASLSATADFTVGLALSAFLGGTVDLQAALAFSYFKGGAINISEALSFSYSRGIALALNDTLDISIQRGASIGLSNISVALSKLDVSAGVVEVERSDIEAGLKSLRILS